MGKGKSMIKENLTEWKHIVRPGSDDCHYRRYLVSGAQLLGYVADCTACLSVAREGKSGSLVNMNANFKEGVYAMDELEVTVRLESVGNRSRKFSFTIYKTMEFSHGETGTPQLLDTPVLAVDGTCVLVRKD